MLVHTAPLMHEDATTIHAKTMADVWCWKEGMVSILALSGDIVQIKFTLESQYCRYKERQWEEDTVIDAYGLWMV